MGIGGQPVTIVVDVANVMGSRPDGWWRDRAGAAVRLHADITRLAGSGRAILPDERGETGTERAGVPGFVMVLEDLVVHKEYQGKGYGSKLLQHAIDFAKQKNFLRITLLTDRPENVAQEFFRRHGFVESSMIPMRLWINPQNSERDQ